MIEEFLKSGGVVETDSAAPTEQRWHLGEYTSSYFNDSPVTTYTLQLLAHETPFELVRIGHAGVECTKTSFL